MREVAGALERPSDTTISIAESAEGTTVTIPPPRMPLILYVPIAMTYSALALVFVIGLFIFILGRTFPGYESLIGTAFRPLPAYWRWFGGTGWVVLLAAGFVTLRAVVEPLLRSEEIVFASSQLLLRGRSFGRTSERSVPASSAAVFRCRRDPTGMRQSQLVLLLKDGDEIDFGHSTTEFEKVWLASVLNALLGRLR